MFRPFDATQSMPRPVTDRPKQPVPQGWSASDTLHVHTTEVDSDVIEASELIMLGQASSAASRTTRRLRGHLENVPLAGVLLRPFVALNTKWLKRCMIRPTT